MTRKEFQDKILHIKLNKPGLGNNNTSPFFNMLYSKFKFTNDDFLIIDSENFSQAEFEIDMFLQDTGLRWNDLSSNYEKIISLKKGTFFNTLDLLTYPIFSSLKFDNDIDFLNKVHSYLRSQENELIITGKASTKIDIPYFFSSNLPQVSSHIIDPQKIRASFFSFKKEIINSLAKNPSKIDWHEAFRCFSEIELGYLLDYIQQDKSESIYSWIKSLASYYFSSKFKSEKLFLQLYSLKTSIESRMTSEEKAYENPSGKVICMLFTEDDFADIFDKSSDIYVNIHKQTTLFLEEFLTELTKFLNQTINEFRLLGEYWSIRFNGTHKIIADMIGIRIIHLLLRNPKKTFELDEIEKYKKECLGKSMTFPPYPDKWLEKPDDKDQIKTLNNYINELKNDPKKKELVKVLNDKLSSLIHWKLAQPWEQWRKNQQGDISKAIKKLDTVGLTDLKKYLKNTIKTGHQLSYSEKEVIFHIL